MSANERCVSGTLRSVAGKGCSGAAVNTRRCPEGRVWNVFIDPESFPVVPSEVL